MGPEAVTASGGFSIAGPPAGADAPVYGLFFARGGLTDDCRATDVG